MDIAELRKLTEERVDKLSERDEVLGIMGIFYPELTHVELAVFLDVDLEMPYTYFSKVREVTLGEKYFSYKLLKVPPPYLDHYFYAGDVLFDYDGKLTEVAEEISKIFFSTERKNVRREYYSSIARNYLDMASQAMKHECFNSAAFFSPFAIMEGGKILVEASGMIGLWPYLPTRLLRVLEDVKRRDLGKNLLRIFRVVGKEGKAEKHLNNCLEAIKQYSLFIRSSSEEIELIKDISIRFEVTSCVNKVFTRILTKIFDILVKGESFFSAFFLLDWCLEKIIKGVTWILKVKNREFKEYKLLDYENENEILMSLKNSILSASRIEAPPKEYSEKIYEDSLKVLEEFLAIKDKLG
ncbi:MAG: hypothetical protein ACTSXW_05625 [Candidatus Baldrarchaeia archaeon]